jgi:hypothetical protein
MARCQYTKDDGERCRAAALIGEEFCLFHSPGRAEEVEEHRRLGGVRRRRERAVAAAYDYLGLRTIPDILRVLESAVTDTLSLDNSVGRNRTLAYLVEIARRCQESDLEHRVQALEAALRNRQVDASEVLDLEPDLLEAEPEEASP